MTRALLAPLIAACLGALLPPAVSQTRAADEALVAAWAALPEAARRDVVERFEAEVAALDTFQGRLLAHALALEEADPGLLPVDGEAPFYDPKVHTPKDVIRRERLEPDRRAAVKLRGDFLGRHAPRRYRSGWRYDWGRGEVLRVGELEDPERTVRNALAGVGPGIDLAEALLERALDDGSQRAALAAFGHAYTDRAGKVYPGLTLYDGWTSGRTREMPDVDNLGVVHDLLDDWDTWVSPVPASKQKRLYTRVGELFAPAHAHRALRTALARTYLLPEPALRDGYEFQNDRLQALWDEQSSEIEAMAAALPAAGDVQDFNAAAAMRIETSAELIGAGVARRERLESDTAAVRELMLAILADAGVRTGKRKR